MKTTDEPLIIFLQKIIHFSVRLLAILMTFVIIWGVGDVVYELYKSLIRPPFMLLNINDILATFGAFMAVLIAIEIFINITVYLEEDVIHIKIVKLLTIKHLLLSHFTYLLKYLICPCSK